MPDILVELYCRADYESYGRSVLRPFWDWVALWSYRLMDEDQRCEACERTNPF